MINYIFASEFDLLRGSIIKTHYPLTPHLFNESLLASYMIPEGSHKREWDLNTFKYQYKLDHNRINNLKIKIQVFRYHEKNEKWESFLKERHILSSTDPILIVYFEKPELLQLKSVKDENLIVFELELHKDLQLTKLNELFYSFYAKDGTSFGLNFENNKEIDSLIEYMKMFEHEEKRIETYFFYNVVKNKRDDNLKRGSLIRSISFCSSTINIMTHFEQIIRHYLTIYSEMTPKQVSKLDQILYELYTNINISIKNIPLRYLYLNPYENIEVPLLLEEDLERIVLEYPLKNNKKIMYNLDNSYFKTYSEVSILDFVKKFGVQTMLIYNAIISEDRVLFIGHDSSSEQTCSYVNSCILLMSPLNISDRIFPYEHLLSVDFVEKQGYIAGVSNPIFSSKKQWWDLCCDVNSGIVIDNRKKKNPENQAENKAISIDNEFINEIIKKINRSELTELDIRSFFYNFTYNFIELSINASNCIDFEKEDKIGLEMIEFKANKFRKTKLFYSYVHNKELEKEKIKLIFGEKYVQISKSINFFNETKFWNDYELITTYNTIIECLKIDSDAILSMIFVKKNTIELLSCGFFSDSEDVRKAGLKLFEGLENSKLGGKLIRKFSYFVLFVYQNIKNKQ